MQCNEEEKKNWNLNKQEVYFRPYAAQQSESIDIVIDASCEYSRFPKTPQDHKPRVSHRTALFIPLP